MSDFNYKYEYLIQTVKDKQSVRPGWNVANRNAFGRSEGQNTDIIHSHSWSTITEGIINFLQTQDDSSIATNTFLHEIKRLIGARTFGEISDIQSAFIGFSDAAQIYFKSSTRRHEYSDILENSFKKLLSTIYNHQNNLSKGDSTTNRALGDARDILDDNNNDIIFKMANLSLGKLEKNNYKCIPPDTIITVRKYIKQHGEFYELGEQTVKRKKQTGTFVLASALPDANTPRLTIKYQVVTTQKTYQAIHVKPGE